MVRVAMRIAALSLAACGSPSGSPVEAPSSPGAFQPPAEVPSGADLARISDRGEDVPSLEAYLVPGKVTVFDFYADWCGPCRKIDAHMLALLEKDRKSVV